MQSHALPLTLYYATSAVFLSLYGTQVCTFHSGVGLLAVLPIYVAAFGIAFLARTFLFSREAKEPSSGAAGEFKLWIFVSIFVTSINHLVFDFPFGTAPKVLIGCLALGLPASTLYGLLLERDQIHQAQHITKRMFPLGTPKSIPIHVYKSTLIAQVLLASVILLLLIKDLGDVRSLSGDDMTSFVRHLGLEIITACAALLCANALVAHQYSKNLELLLDQQASRIDAVARGNLDVFVPVVNNHELARIGHSANTMIETLRERERVKSIFGKLVSPQVARALLEDDHDGVLGGKSVNAVVLFTDIRDFTAISEACSAEAVVSLLNEYFTMLVGVVHSEGGVVDKFIGDAAMAVFGLDNELDPTLANDAAFRAASAIRSQLESVNHSLSERGLPNIVVGFGLHYGVVLAGNIGSADRLEYTVIGDTVNVASRLEGLSKKTGKWLSVSSVAYHQMSVSNQAQLKLMGDFQVKGKKKSISVYGPV